MSNFVQKDLNFSLEGYAGEVVSQISQTIIPTGKWICRAVYGYGRVEYQYYPEEQLYIWRIPTAPDVEGNDFKYYFVAVKFLAEIDRELYEDAVRSIFTRFFDLKRCDSGSIFVVSPRIRYTHLCRLRAFGKKAYLKWMELVRGANIRVRSFPIVAKTVEKAVHRILKFMYTFTSKRLWALAEAVGVSSGLHDYSEQKLISLLTDYIIEVNRELVRSFIIYMSRLSMHLRERLKRLVGEIRLKITILNELRSFSTVLNIPRGVVYTLFSKPVDMIISIARQYTSNVKVKLRGKHDYRETDEYAFKLLGTLKSGRYTVG